MQARYYDPLLGRFYANDPVGFQENNPLSFNRYAYANNNPYKFVDPDGRSPVKLASATGKTIYKIYKSYTKSGSINRTDLRKIGGEELAGMTGDLYTIFGDANASVVDKVKAGVDLATGLETNKKGDEVAANALKRLVRDPFKGQNPNAKVQDLLKGTGQLAALDRNDKIGDFHPRDLFDKTLPEVKDLLSKEQFKTFMKHFEDRDLRHGK